MKDHWLGIAFSVAALLCLVVATTIIHITNEKAWCDSESLTICVRNWISSAGTVLVGIAAAIIAALQWRAALIQTHLTRIDRRLEIALKVRRICVELLQELKGLPENLIYMEEQIKKLPSSAKDFSSIYIAPACEVVSRLERELSKLYNEEVVDTDISRVVRNLYLLSRHLSSQFWTVNHTISRLNDMGDRLSNEKLSNYFLSINEEIQSFREIAENIPQTIDFIEILKPKIEAIIRATSDDRQRLDGRS